MRNVILLLVLPVMAACATPRETCLKAATKDIQVVDQLILETQANLSRGYGIEKEPYVTSTVDLCLGSGGYGYGRNRVGVGWSYCNTPTTRYKSKPVAIDRAAEQRKLRELKETRARLVRESDARLAQCNAQYPQG
ncbi:hypothetical protein [Tropicimonas marinistellae]|uniref:hypothetical protein n=1 Tax=Tropicimonas marinistellae TaxID=1739787 RepID=UPI00082F0DDD|nr:hypothetical protein [Tropicimonas marinistellae]